MAREGPDLLRMQGTQCFNLIIVVEMQHAHTHTQYNTVIAHLQMEKKQNNEMVKTVERVGDCKVDGVNSTCINNKNSLSLSLYKAFV